MKMVILDGFATNPGDLSWNFLGKYGEFTVYEQTDPKEVAERCSDAEAVFTGRRGITGEDLSRCPKLKYINTLGTGYDMIDIEYCRSHGITVCNTPAYSSDSVAQMAFSLILGLTTDLDTLRRDARNGKWTGMTGYSFQGIPHTELSGLTLGLVGCGSIGKRVATIATAFGMNVMATTETRTSGNDGEITFLPLDKMLAQSDIVSLHCPLTEKTKGMVDEGFIAKMKEGAILINTARGAVINEGALYEALKSLRISAAGLDVLAVEPPSPDNPLLSLDNCLVTPHISWATKAARQRLQRMLERNISVYLNGGELTGRIV